MRYRMPAEWEPHEGTWLAWPHEQTDWPGKFESVPWVYGEIVRHLSRTERVHILVNSPDDEQTAKTILRKVHADLQAVDFLPCRTDRSWTRDFCPTFVRDESKEIVLLDWRFNGWAKYENWEVDDAVPSAIAEKIGFARVEPELGGRRIVLEGGSIEVNGCGSLLTTEECLLSEVQARNPGLVRSDLESAFNKYLGITNTLWLKNGIAGDDTHGHIDDLARFVSPGVVVLAVEKDSSDSNYQPLQENLAILRRCRTEAGDPIEVVPLPMPRPLYFEGQRLPASYANFYIANQQVLVPTFNDPGDKDALHTLQSLFPDHEVTGIHAVDLVLGLGTLHCMTQQQIAP